MFLLKMPYTDLGHCVQDYSKILISLVCVFVQQHHSKVMFNLANSCKSIFRHCLFIYLLLSWFSYIDGASRNQMGSLYQDSLCSPHPSMLPTSNPNNSACPWLQKASRSHTSNPLLSRSYSCYWPKHLSTDISDWVNVCKIRRRQPSKLPREARTLKLAFIQWPFNYCGKT